MSHIKLKNENNETLKAGCVLLNEKGEVLLVTDPAREAWGYPKGHMEEGETPEETAVREVEEETGYKVKLIKRLSDLVYTRKDGELVRVIMFKAETLQKISSGENKSFPEWLPLTKAREVIYPPIAFLLDEI